MPLSRTQLQIRVSYDAPVSECRRTLRVLPLERANQSVLRQNWQIEPLSDIQKQDAGRLFVFHSEIEREFCFDLELEVETASAPITNDEPPGRFLLPSRAVVFVPELLAVARETKNLAPLERAAFFNRFCFESLEYTVQTSPQPPSSSAVWAQKRGTCADFAHVFESLCRASGLPARYVAGFNPAEGQMHGWAEVLIENEWRPFDPTHGRAPSPGCVAVAVGRDFYDCAPHVGSFRGQANAHLELWTKTTVA